MTRHRFRLFHEPAHFWSFADYAAVVDAVEWFKPATVLEFGPGASTLALVEGGATAIDACEDDPHWEHVYRARLQKVYPVVTIRPYTWADPLTIPDVDGRRFDFALIDGPHQTPRRAVVLVYALAHCDVVMMAVEDSDGMGLRQVIAGVVGSTPNRSVDFIQTGPLAGSFAIIE